jgi:hypothetical protein
MTKKTLFCSFYVSFCTFCASLWLTRTVFTRPKTSIFSVNPVILPALEFRRRGSDIFRVLRGEIIPEISVNPWLINDLRSTKDYVRKNNLFMQNKANFRKVKLNVNKVLTKDYDQMDTWSIRKTKPIQSQSKPIQSQSKPIQSQLKPIKCQNKPNLSCVASGEAGSNPTCRGVASGNCTLTYLCRLKSIADSGIIPGVNRFRETSNRRRQINDILGVKSMKRCILLIVLITMLGVCNVWADWPQYLGPNRNATSDEKGLLRSWPAEGPKVLWTFELGAGFGGGAITKDKVYLLDRIPRKQDVFRCIDLNSGKELWSFAYDAPGRVSNPGSRSTESMSTHAAA